MDDASTLWDRKKAQTRDDLVRAALGLFRRKGFDATTVEEIVAAARTSPRTLFRYFGSKEDLVFHDLQDHLKFARGRLPEMLERHGVWDGVARTVIAVVTRFVSADAALAAERLEAWIREPMLRQRFAALCLQWESSIADAVATYRKTRAAHDPYARTVGIVAVASVRIAMETTRRRGFVEDLQAVLEEIGGGLRHEPAPAKPKRRSREA